MIKDIMKTVAIIGGTQTDTLIKLGKRGDSGTTSYRRNQTLQKESTGKYY